MKNILLKIAYDGTDFAGFQQQEQQRTVAGVLQEAVETVTRRPTRLITAGRTDAGVHAEEQLVNFLYTGTVPPHRMAQAVGRHLPEDLFCYASREVPLDFHARFAVTEKVYRYQLVNGPSRFPQDRRTWAWSTYPLDRAAMERCFPFFLGKHDFSAFSRWDPSRNAVREIHDLQMRWEGDRLRLWVRGQSFLYQQIRIMVGALIDCGRGRLSQDDIIRALKRGGREPIAPTAPACGLTLEEMTWVYPMPFRA